MPIWHPAWPTWMDTTSLIPGILTIFWVTFVNFWATFVKVWATFVNYLGDFRILFGEFYSRNNSLRFNPDFRLIRTMCGGPTDWSNLLLPLSFKRVVAMPSDIRSIRRLLNDRNVAVGRRYYIVSFFLSLSFAEVICSLSVLFHVLKWVFPSLFFILFIFNGQFTVSYWSAKGCSWMDSNPDSLVLEATAQSTVPPIRCLILPSFLFSLVALYPP